jgi:hypothetical protein
MSESQESQLPDVSADVADPDVEGPSPAPVSPPPAGTVQEIEIEPIEFRWTKQDAKIWDAVQEYCEETYADY